MCRLDGLHGQNHVAAIGTNRRVQLTGPQKEDRILGVLRIRELQQGVCRADEPRFAHHQVMLFRQIVQGDLVGLADGSGQLVRRVASQLIGLREQERHAQRFFHFFERLGVSGLFFQYLDYVDANLRADQVRDRAHGQAEGRLFVFGQGLSLPDPANVAPLVLGGILRVFFGQVLELSALPGLF